MSYGQVCKTSWSEWQRPGPIDRTPGLPGSDKKRHGQNFEFCHGISVEPTILGPCWFRMRAQNSILCPLTLLDSPWLALQVNHLLGVLSWNANRGEPPSPCKPKLPGRPYSWNKDMQTSALCFLFAVKDLLQWAYQALLGVHLDLKPQMFNAAPLLAGTRMPYPYL